jgi:hypothetical protein
MALFWRIWLAIAIVLTAVLAIFVGLATLQFGQVNAELVAERMAVLADRTGGPLEAAAKLGLPLSSVRNTPALLERARQTDDAITAIHVHDREGRIVHSTMETPPVTIPYAEVTAQNGSGYRYFETADGIVGAFDIAGRSGEPAGGILITYARQGSVTLLRAMAAELSLIAALVLLVSAAVGGLLLRVGLAPQIRAFEAVDRAVGEFERDSWRSAAGATTAKTDDDARADELRRLLDAADARYRTAGRAIAEATAPDSYDGRHA